MKENVLKQMIAVVDEVVKHNKTDFYKYDLHRLSAYETPEFLWSVRETGTSLMVIDGEDLMMTLRNSETARFSFMHNPSWELHSFLYFPCVRSFHYKNGELKEVENIKVVAEEVWKPIQEKISNVIIKEFGEAEGCYWKAKINIHFGSTSTAKKIYKALHEKGAESLANILNSFRRYERLAIDDSVTISCDFNGKDFFFSHVCNGKPMLCGGILFYDGKWHKHT